MEIRASRPSRPTAASPSPHGTGPALFTSPEHKARLEARNGLLQFDAVLELIHAADGVLRLDAEMICRLQGIAIQDIYTCAGHLRDGPVEIKNSSHKPPDHFLIPLHLREMCEYANSICSSDPLLCSAYLMWRVNWIHPFFGGNGRTSRAVGYLALCVGFNLAFPGTTTIPDLIEADRVPYYKALDSADAHYAAGRLDVSEMQQLVESLLLQQLETAS